MDLAQVKLAKSFPDLVGSYYLIINQDAKVITPGESEAEEPVTTATTGEDEEAEGGSGSESEHLDPFDEARVKWSDALDECPGKRLRADLSALQDAMNTSVDTAVRIGKVRVAADAVTGVAGEPVRLPMSLEEAARLYRKLDPSLVGVEQRGDVLDASLRRSHEAPAEALAVSEQMASFDFPEELREIHQRLCPSAVSIRAELYKLVIYGEDDFFVPHRDSMTSPEMFGSISVQIPVDCARNESSEPHVGVKRSNAKECNSTDTRRSGQLVFYVGRHLSDVSEQSTSCGFYSYDAESRFAYTVDMEQLGSVSIKDNMIDVPYGAWTGDVLHEVRRIRSGYRAVLVYRLYKEGHRNSYIPRALRETASHLLSRTMTSLEEFKWNEAQRPLPKPLRYIGVILRHAYPPAGLSWRHLKGIDAVFYSIASDTNKCLLFNAHAANEADFFTKHVVNREKVMQSVFLTAGKQPKKFDDGDFFQEMTNKYNMFVGAAWIQLGFGTLCGGGFCYGNADCGTEWWYRSAVMIITPEPSKWKRCKNFLLAVKKGSTGIRRLGYNIQIVETIGSFL